MYERLIQKISREKVSNPSPTVPPPAAKNQTVKSQSEIEDKITAHQQELCGEESDPIKNSVVNKTNKIRNISSLLKKNKLKKKQLGQKNIVELW